MVRWFWWFLCLWGPVPLIGIPWSGFQLVTGALDSSEVDWQVSYCLYLYLFLVDVGLLSSKESKMVVVIYHKGLLDVNRSVLTVGSFTNFYTLVGARRRSWSSWLRIICWSRLGWLNLCWLIYSYHPFGLNCTLLGEVLCPSDFISLVFFFRFLLYIIMRLWYMMRVSGWALIGIPKGPLIPSIILTYKKKDCYYRKK
jgi:hypothetical protein